MRAMPLWLLVAALMCLPATARSQDRFRVAANAGIQATAISFVEEQTYEQYFETGTFTFERSIPKSWFIDGGVSVRIWRGLRAGVAVTLFDNSGNGELTARVPHPLYFDRPRTVSGEVGGTRRYELGQHISAGWSLPTSRDVDLTFFGGPSIFTTEQVFVTGLMLSPDAETFPFDTLPFPPVQTETQRENVLGYHAGADISWRLNRTFGVGVLLRYSTGSKDFVPSGGQPVEIRVGGFHAGGGLRLTF